MNTTTALAFGIVAAMVAGNRTLASYSPRWRGLGVIERIMLAALAVFLVCLSGLGLMVLVPIVWLALAGLHGAWGLG